MNSSAAGERGSDFSLVIAIPVYNDWDAAGLCLRQLDAECLKSFLRPVVLIINDGSTMPIPDEFTHWRPASFAGLEVLELYRNLGHQRAICVGLAHISHTWPDAAVLIMDADGEDPPSGVIALIEAYRANCGKYAIFAARKRRIRGFLFRVCYQIYRLIHFALVGFDIRIGNFSIVPPLIAAQLVRSSELWNHYAACVVKSKLPVKTIPIDRANRLGGRSKMKFTNLVVHGLSAMSVYNEVIGVRTLVFASLLLVFGLAVLVAVVCVRLFTPFAIPGWATNAFALTLILILQIATVSLLFTFGILAARSGPTFIPIRDCPHLVMNIRRLLPDHA
jgi:glycosyltransferase involved in cell wall biosynthesis